MKDNKKGAKSIALLLALMLLIGCVAGGTIAWLVAAPQSVTNTFVAGKIGALALTEDDNTSKVDGSYLIVPGTTMTKDPTVTYTPDTEKADSVAAYVFIQVAVDNENWVYNSTDKQFELKYNDAVVLSFKVAGDWTYLEDGVYYIEVAAGASLAATSIIAGDAITVANSITDGTVINAVVDAANNLIFKAYAIQQDGFDDAADAWAALNP